MPRHESMSKTLRTFNDLIKLKTFEERYDYLKLGANVGDSTFGFDRYLNQRFYSSPEWRRIRDHVIARDEGLDLATKGYEIYDRIIVHHMNPMSVDDVALRNIDILDPKYLITTTHKTHNAIHYGDEKLLAKPPIERRPGDTLLWGNNN